MCRKCEVERAQEWPSRCCSTNVRIQMFLKIEQSRGTKERRWERSLQVRHDAKASLRPSIDEDRVNAKREKELGRSKCERNSRELLS